MVAFLCILTLKSTCGAAQLQTVEDCGCDCLQLYGCVRHCWETVCMLSRSSQNKIKV